MRACSTFSRRVSGVVGAVLVKASSKNPAETAARCTSPSSLSRACVGRGPQYTSKHARSEASAATLLMAAAKISSLFVFSGALCLNDFSFLFDRNAAAPTRAANVSD